MLSQVIGFVDHDHKGTMGVERTMQDFLQGTDGFRYIETDRTGKELVPYRGQESPAKDGCDVKLTVDLGLQNIVESELDAACAEFKPKDATVIMMRPQTGEILAMASRPSFDPNKSGEATPDQEKNRSVVDMVEPGSTFKIVTTSAVIEEKLVTPDTTVFCENGHFQYAGRVLRDAHRDGGSDRAPSVDEIEQHRRRKTGSPARRSEVVRVRPAIRVWTENRRRLERRDLRSGQSALPMEQARYHSDSHGSVGGGHSVANGDRNVMYRERRQVDEADDCFGYHRPERAARGEFHS